MKSILAALVLWTVTCAAQEVSSIAEQRVAAEQDDEGQTLALAKEQKGKYAIIGTVIDRSTQEPVANAKVTILGTKFVTKTAGDGQYRIEAIAEGFYQVRAEAAGYESQVFNNVPLGLQNQRQQLFFTLNKSAKEPPPDFIPVEKQPVPITNPAPDYPESARRAKLEGTVWIKIWVDEQGKARKATVIKSDNEIFNRAAMDAAIQWTFEPAMLNHKPVAVWVSIPFKFKLNQVPADGENPGEKK